MRVIPSAMAIVLSFGVAFALAVDISSANPEAAAEIRTVLPFDAIPSIDNPIFVSAEKAKKFMAPDEMVIGLDINGDRRAYSVPLLSSHEIVNDVVGGKKIAVTW